MIATKFCAVAAFAKILADPMGISTYGATTVATFVSLALAGCDRNVQSTTSRSSEDRSQTKALQAASVVGYDGKQLQKQVDKILEQKEKRNRDLEKELNDIDRH
jgi:Holliday junction resolvasome RuvABC DNA-binding subunit